VHDMSYRRGRGPRVGTAERIASESETGLPPAPGIWHQNRCNNGAPLEGRPAQPGLTASIYNESGLITVPSGSVSRLKRVHSGIPLSCAARRVGSTNPDSSSRCLSETSSYIQ